MDIVKRFNNLDGKSVGRRSLKRIAEKAKELGYNEIHTRIVNVLEKYPDVSIFEVVIGKKVAENTGLGIPEKKQFKNLKEVKKHYLDWAAKNLIGKKVFHKGIGKWVHFNYKGVSHSISSFLDKDRISLITQAEEMLKKSNFIEFKEDYRKRRNIKGAYKMESTGVLNGKKIGVILTLREGNNGVIYYDHKIKEKENSKTPSTPTRTKKSCVADQCKRASSESKDTKKYEKIKKRGLGVPITPQLRKKIFRPNGRLNKGFYYDNDGFLTDGKQFFVDYTKGYDAFKEQVVKSQKKAKEKAEKLAKEDKSNFGKTENKAHKQKIIRKTKQEKATNENKQLYRHIINIGTFLNSENITIPQSMYSLWIENYNTELYFEELRDFLLKKRFFKKYNLDIERESTQKVGSLYVETVKVNSIDITTNNRVYYNIVKKRELSSPKVSVKQQVQINADKLIIEELQEKDFLRQPTFFDLKKVKERIKRIKENTGVEISYTKSEDAYHLVSKDYSPRSALYGKLGAAQLPEIEIEVISEEEIPEVETPPTPTEAPQPKVIAPPITPTKKNGAKTLAEKLKEFRSKEVAYFGIETPDLLKLLGNIERKEKESVVITIAGSQGSMKTRFAFQFINAMAKNYRVGHASIEEHPDSALYYEKVEQYISPENMGNIENPEIGSVAALDKLIKRNDVIVIDSFAKLQEIESKFEIDKDLRKKYNGKLFLVVFQQTTDGKMRGGSKSQFDGDIILMVQKENDYTKNFVYNNKNRYNKIPLNELHYNIHSQTTYNPEAVNEESEESEEYELVV